MSLVRGHEVTWVAIIGCAILQTIASCGGRSNGDAMGGRGDGAVGGGSGGAVATGAGGAFSPGTGGMVVNGTGGNGSGGMTGNDGGSAGAAGTGQGGATAFMVTSPTLPSGGMFPVDATCETTRASSQMPALTWTAVPAGTMSFAMVFVDTTLTGMTPPNVNGFHSAMWDIPASVRMLPQGLPAGSPPLGVAGLETVKQKKAPSGMAWLGPCPNFPSTTRTRTDTYNFQLYALAQSSLPANVATMTIQQIQALIEALPPLAKAVLAGTSNAAAATLK
jgi:phosphatidylethanolamine-binding protein (PEBP) family uncharacterized protein